MPAESFKRKLTAILSADVKGYSRLMGDNEAETVRTLTSYRKIMGELIQKHRGRVIDSPGDNLLAEFASVVDAVQCSVAVQNELKARNAGLPEDRRMVFRMGVNVGDVIEEEGRIYGDGVNITARLEALAEPGGICISKTVFDHIERKLPLGYQFLGEQTVKNIAKPVGAYKILMEPGVPPVTKKKNAKEAAFWQRRPFLAIATAVLVIILGVLVWTFYMKGPQFEPASKEKIAFPLPDKPSIAVLPFANLSGDPGQDFLVDGITENITTALSCVPEIFVVARNSTFTFKGKAVKVQRIAEELGVRYVLEGSILRSEDRIRVTAQLIDALKGHHLWAERYDRELKDLFALQDDLTMKILNGLALKLLHGEQVLHPRAPKSLETYLRMMQGFDYLRNSSIDSNNRARVIGEEIIGIEPDYWGGHLLVGSVHMMDYWLGSSKDPAHALNMAIQRVEESAALTDRKGNALEILGHLHSMNRDYDKAVEVGEQAIALIPNGADAHALLAMSLNYAGRPEEALPLFEKAMRLNPIPPAYYYLNNGLSYSLLGRFEEAVFLYKKAIQLTPDSSPAYAALAATYGLMGREKEAKAAAADLLRVDPKFSVEYAAKTNPAKRPADTQNFIQGLRKAGLK